ncbi:MAG: HNH endonuclease [Candidatus Susulua stagnicola]|nr:HNH endonuclease [Candidatus Susulua stagnicola]
MGILVVIVILYFLPFIMSLFGEEEDIPDIAVASLLIGWTVIWWFIGLSKAIDSIERKRQRLADEQQWQIDQESQEKWQRARDEEIENKYKGKPIETILFANDLTDGEKATLIAERGKYTLDEAQELIVATVKEARKAKLQAAKRKISKKAQELHGNIPSDDRQPIPEDVQNQVWNRDKGKCVRCSSKEKLEFDHIIPFSKGGANTTRNLQLLCEKCNRSKSNNIG